MSFHVPLYLQSCFIERGIVAFLRLSQGYREMTNCNNKNNNDITTSYSKNSNDRNDFVKSLPEQQA